MIIKPAQLALGDTIGFTSPSLAYKQDYVQPALDRLKQIGFNVKIAENAFKHTYGYAASPEERADDFV